MPDITIKFRDGRERVFKEGRRSGGSYSQKVRCKDGFVTVVDVWGGETAFPSDTVAEVLTAPLPGGW